VAVAVYARQPADADADPRGHRQPHGRGCRICAGDSARRGDLLRGRATPACGNWRSVRGRVRRLFGQLRSFGAGPAPAGADPAAPEGADSAAPEGADSAAPADTDPAAPADTDPAAPADTGSAAPADTDPAAPADSDPAAPADADPAAPAGADPANPTDTGESIAKAFSPQEDEENYFIPNGSFDYSYQAPTVESNANEYYGYSNNGLSNTYR